MVASSIMLAHASSNCSWRMPARCSTPALCSTRPAVLPIHPCARNAARTAVVPCFKASPRRSRRSAAGGRVVAAAASRPSLQLATAKLPPGVDEASFAQQLYQWAATLTTNGRNMPFALPLRTDPLPSGFQISLLRVVGSEVLSVADLEATVEPVEGTGRVLFVRLLEGPASEIMLGAEARASGDAQQRLKTLLAGLVDVPLIMQTMPGAIHKAASLSS